MKVWIVYYSDITVDCVIVGIYATRELAERAAQRAVAESTITLKTATIRDYNVEDE